MRRHFIALWILPQLLRLQWKTQKLRAQMPAWGSPKSPRERDDAAAVQEQMRALFKQREALNRRVVGSNYYRTYSNPVFGLVAGRAWVLVLNSRVGCVFWDIEQGFYGNLRLNFLLHPALLKYFITRPGWSYLRSEKREILRRGRQIVAIRTHK